MTERWIAVSRTGNFLHLPWGLAAYAWALAELDAAGEAVSRIKESEKLLQRQAERGILSSLDWAYHALSSASLRVGRLDDAQRLRDRGVESFEYCLGFATHALRLLGDIATHPDRFDAQSGEAHYRRALALAEARGMRPWSLTATSASAAMQHLSARLWER